jgi:hypothetical protein
MASETSPTLASPVSDLREPETPAGAQSTESQPVEAQPTLKEQIVGTAVAAKDKVVEAAIAAKDLVLGASETVREKLENVQNKTTEKLEAALDPHMEKITREAVHVKGVATRATANAAAVLHERAKEAAASLREQDTRQEFAADGTKRSPFPYCDNLYCVEYAPCPVHGTGSREAGDQQGTWTNKVKEEAKHVKEVIVHATAQAAEIIAEKTGVAKEQLEEQQRHDAEQYGKDYLPESNSNRLSESNN